MGKKIQDLKADLEKSAGADAGSAEDPAPLAPMAFSACREPETVFDGDVQAFGQRVKRTRRATMQLLKRLLRTTTDAQLRTLGLVRRRSGTRARPSATMPRPCPSGKATGDQVQMVGFSAVPVGVSIINGASTTQLRTQN